MARMRMSLHLNCSGLLCLSKYVRTTLNLTRSLSTINGCLTVYGAEREAEIYALVDSYQIAPHFLAHVAENNGDGDGDDEKIIGFMG
jgi:hypothetical protein